MPRPTLTQAPKAPAAPISRPPRSRASSFTVEACERRTLLAASFAPAIQLTTDPLPRQTVVADFNGDGLPDIATIVPEENEVIILINNGNGTFSHVQRLADSEPRAIAAGDFNNDGRIDLAVFGPDLTLGNAVVRIFNGRGNGTFVSVVAETHVFSGGPTLTAVDLNGDGLTDLVATTNGRVAVLMGNGNSTFAKAKYYFIGDEPPTDLAIGDLNGDGVPDLVVTRGRLSQVAVFLGRPSNPGTFGTPVFYNTGGNPSSVTLGDFNGDGKLDVAVSNEQFRGNSMAVLQGNGDGTLQPAALYGGANFADRIVSGDFSGSGDDDIIVGAFDGSTNLYTNDGAGIFAPPTPIQNAQFTQFMSVGDINGDGKPDLIVTPYKYIRVLLNTSGTQTPPVLGPGLDQTITSTAAASFYTADGTQVTVGMSGPGRATLHFTSTQAVNVPSGVTTIPVTARTLGSISISGSTAATTFSIRVVGGSTTVNVSSLTTNSVIGSINAPRMNVSTLSLPGGVSNVQLLSANNGAMTIGGNARPSLQFGGIGNEVVTVTPVINSLQLSQDASGMTLTAPSIKQMSVFGGIVNSTINLTASSSTDLGSLNVTGGLLSSTIFSASDIGPMTLGSIIGSRVLAGVGQLQPGEFLPTTDSEFATNATIKSITLRPGIRYVSFANSSIAAFNIGAMSLNRVQTYNGGAPFGVAAHFISTLSGLDLTTKRSFSIGHITSSSVATIAFARQRIDPQDLLVDIL